MGPGRAENPAPSGAAPGLDLGNPGLGRLPLPTYLQSAEEEMQI